MRYIEGREQYRLGGDEREPERDTLTPTRGGRGAGRAGTAGRGTKVKTIEGVAERRRREPEKYPLKPLERAQLRDPRAADAERHEHERQHAAGRGAERGCGTCGDRRSFGGGPVHAESLDSVPRYGVNPAMEAAWAK